MKTGYNKDLGGFNVKDVDYNNPVNIEDIISWDIIDF